MANAYDTFDGTTGDNLVSDHTSDSGHSWAVTSGQSAGEITGNELQDVIANGNDYANIVFTPSDANYRVWLDVGDGSSWQTGPAGRMNGDPDGYLVYWDDSVGVWRLYELSNGSFTSIGTGSGTDPNTADQRCLLLMNGTTIEVDYGSAGTDPDSLTNTISVTDSTHTAAGVGGFSYVADSAERIKYFAIHDDLTGDVGSGPSPIAASTSVAFSVSASLEATGTLAASLPVAFSEGANIEGIGALATTIALAFSESANLESTSSIAATIPVTFSESVSLEGAGALTTTIPITFAESLALEGLGELQGTIPITFSTAADLQGGGAVSATIPMTFSELATLEGTGALQSTIPITFSQLATLEADGALAATATMTFSTSANLENAVEGAVSGTVAITFSTGADLAGLGALAASMPIAFVVSGALDQPAAEAEAEDAPTGGRPRRTSYDEFWFRFDQERERKRWRLAEERRKLIEARRLEDELHRELAIAERATEAEDARRLELERIARLIDANRPALLRLGQPRVIMAAEAVAEDPTFSRMERLEREVTQARKKQQDFLAEATRILLESL